MPHELEGHVHWHEPEGNDRAGLLHYPRPKSAYDRFVESEGVPIHRSPFWPALAEVPLADWRRLGARGAYLQQAGTDGRFGCHLVEVPGAGETMPERHLFAKQMLVLSGRGTLELFGEAGDPRLIEWRAGTLFAVPRNRRHRLVNALGKPALLLACTAAPPLIDLLGGPAAVFDNSYSFPETDGGGGDIEPDPMQGLAACRAEAIDAEGCDLPRDNRRGPGYRRLAPLMDGGALETVIEEYWPARYGRAAAEPPGAASICLGGRGFVLLWPEEASPTPFAAGHGARVLRVALAQGVMFARAPGPGRWFHQVFNTCGDPLRLLAWSGPLGLPRPPGPPGEMLADEAALDIAEGGTAVPYWLEDAAMRRLHDEALGGRATLMRPAWYDAPP